MTKPIPTDAQMDLFREEWYKHTLAQGINGLAADHLQVGGNHYKDMSLQPWEVMENVLTSEEFEGFLKGNIIKYSMRQGKKADSDDANKAKHYLMKLKEVRGY